MVGWLVRFSTIEWARHYEMLVYNLGKYFISFSIYTISLGYGNTTSSLIASGEICWVVFLLGILLDESEFLGTL